MVEYAVFTEMTTIAKRSPTLAGILDNARAQNIHLTLPTPPDFTALDILLRPYILRLAGIVVLYIVIRKLSLYICRVEAQRTKSLVVCYGTVYGILPDVARAAHQVKGIIRHPNIWKAFGWLSGRSLTTMAVITSKLESSRFKMGVLRFTQLLRPVADGKPIRSGTVISQRLYPILKSAECQNYFRKKISSWVTNAGIVINVLTTPGGSSAAMVAANTPGLVRNTVGAANMVNIIIETVPLEGDRLGNIQLVNHHYFESALASPDLNIIVQQRQHEITEINSQLGPFIALLGATETAKSDDTQNLTESQGPALAYIVDLGEFPAEKMRLPERIGEVFWKIEKNMEDTINRHILTRTIGERTGNGFKGPEIKGKTISLLMFQPEKSNFLEVAVDAVQGQTDTNLVSRKAVEWRERHLRIFLLVSLTAEEARCTYTGQDAPENAYRPRLSIPRSKPLESPNQKNPDIHEQVTMEQAIGDESQ